jgi:hypothetical protein
MTSSSDGSIRFSLNLQADPRDDGEDEFQLQPSMVADVVSTLDKAVRSQRLYQPNNPVYQGFVRAVRKVFSGLWDHASILNLGVEEQGFRYGDRTYTAGEGRDSLSYLFYKDGVRFISFLPGFEDEVEVFLSVLNRARAEDQQRGDEDMVTLLWQQEFTCFQYSYVDALADDLTVPQSTVPKLAGFELTLVPESEMPGAAERPDRPPQSMPPAVQAGQPSVAGLVNRDDFDETLYFLDPGELARLREELELELSRDLKTDVLNALFDRLEDGYPTWRTDTLHILRQMLPVFLGAGDLPSATRILVELNSMRDRGVLTEEHRDDVEALFRELSDPAVLSQLLHSLDDGSIDPSSDDLGIFLQHLGPAAMPVLLAAIERNVAGALQERLRVALEGLASAHREQLLALLRSPEVDVVRGAARLAGQLGEAEAAPVLTELLKRNDVLLRRVAVEALVRIRTWAALEGLQQALTDNDREVRIAAARGLSVLRYPPARARLQELLDSRMLREADLTEKIAFFEAYGSVADANSVAMLDRLLNGRRLLQKEAPEIRACAAMALGKVGSPVARAALERAREDANPMVRNAVMKAIRQERA